MVRDRSECLDVYIVKCLDKYLIVLSYTLLYHKKNGNVGIPNLNGAHDYAAFLTLRFVLRLFIDAFFLPLFFAAICFTLGSLPDVGIAVQLPRSQSPLIGSRPSAPCIRYTF